MTSALSSIAPISNAVALRQASAAPAAPETTAPANAAVVDTSAAFSQRFKNDPNAGLIVQFYGEKGEVVSQVPSQTVVAYLRAGLTAEGLRREDTSGALA